jgi:hypothetical protein
MSAMSDLRRLKGLRCHHEEAPEAQCGSANLKPKEAAVADTETEAAAAAVTVAVAVTAAEAGCRSLPPYK